MGTVLGTFCRFFFFFLVLFVVIRLPTQEMQETWVRSLGREDPLEGEMVPHSSILAWKIPWTEEPGGLQSTWSQRVLYDLVTKQQECMYPLLPASDS